MSVLELEHHSQHDFMDLLSIIDIFWRRLPSATKGFFFYILCMNMLIIIHV